jgi:hypothetical protein
MHSINLRVYGYGFIEEVKNVPVKLEPLIIGNGVYGMFALKFSSLVPSSRTYLIAKFNSNICKRIFL